MMMHPAAVKTLKDVSRQLMSGSSSNSYKFAEWVSTKI